MGLAILRGAVQFGLDPSVVTVRRSRLTYGVGVLNRYLEGVHPQVIMKSIGSDYQKYLLFKKEHVKRIYQLKRTSLCPWIYLLFLYRKRGYSQLERTGVLIFWMCLCVWMKVLLWGTWSADPTRLLHLVRPRLFCTSMPRMIINLW